MTIPDSRYNTVPGYNTANNYGPAKPVDHSGMTNEAFDQFYADVSAAAEQKRAKPDSPIAAFVKKLVKKVLK